MILQSMIDILNININHICVPFPLTKRVIHRMMCISICFAILRQDPHNIHEHYMFFHQKQLLQNLQQPPYFILIIIAHFCVLKNRGNLYLLETANYAPFVLVQNTFVSASAI